MDPSHARAELVAQRDALIEAILVEVPPRIPFYAALPLDVQRVGAARLVDLLLDGVITMRLEALRAFGTELFLLRQSQGASPDAILQSLHITRRILQRFARRLPGYDPLHDEFTERIEDVCAELSSTAADVYGQAIEEQRAARAAAETRYQELYRRTPAMMHSLDRDGRIDAVSDRWLETLGFARDEVIGRRSVDFLTEESRREAVEINIPRIRVEGSRDRVHYQFVKKNGDPIDVRLSSVALRDDQGNITNFLAVFEDITAELEAMRAMRESEERWRALMDLAPLPLAIHREGTLLWVNDALVRLLGYPRTELIGENVLKRVHPDDRALVIERVRKSRESEVPLPPTEQRYLHADGSAIHVEVAARPIMFEGGRATQVAFVDVTARNLAARTRAENEAQARVIEAQEESLRALSTPLIPIGEGILVSPLIGRISAARAESILGVLVEGVARHSTRVAIIDVTGVPEADAAVAEALVRVASAIRLLGAEVVITGIQAQIAHTLVELGVEIRGLTTRGTLRDGIAYAMRKRR